MYGEITYSEIDQKFNKEETVFVDVRSKKEFEEATIPGAVNMPILNDEERHVIGTMFVSGKIKEAKEMGVKVGSQKLPEIYSKIEELSEKYKNVVIFCEKGGFRSKSVSYLLRALSINVYRLKGGYRSYRKYINDNLEKLFMETDFVVLYGNTGSGKTKILKELENLGESVLDLEGCANHRGSILGGIGLGKQNSQKMFESLVFDKLKENSGKTVFTEGESKRIGKVIMPNYMYDKLQDSKKVLVEATDEYRIKNLKEEYVVVDNEEIIKTLELLSGLVSEKNMENMKQRIRDKEYDSVISDLMKKYYDTHYKKIRDVDFKILNEDEKKTADILIAKYGKKLIKEVS